MPGLPMPGSQPPFSLSEPSVLSCAILAAHSFSDDISDNIWTLAQLKHTNTVLARSPYNPVQIKAGQR